VSLAEVVEEAATASGWQPTLDGWKRPAPASSLRKNKRYGLGFACGFKNVGFSFGAPEQCSARIELYGTAEVEYAVLYHSAAEVGQGTHTALLQMAAEALDLDENQVRLVVSDTAQTPPSGSVSASRMTFMAGNAILGAAEVALMKWRAEDRPAVGSYTYHPPRTTPYDPETGRCDPNFAYGYVAEAVEVEVDTETGHVRVLR
jgi:CO/xanthine dehydrogenase Mo-binding subunit